MLSVLHIENVAVVERADVEFGARLSVLTGETGAGKSIVIDSINAVLGMRMSRDIVRTGERAAFVSAMFSPVGGAVLGWLEHNGYEAPDGELLITRQISVDGRNVCRIGGNPVTVAMLRELGSLLVNIHGQHDSQQLLDESTHLASLDSFAGDAEALDDYSEKYRNLLEIRSKIQKLSIDAEERTRRVDELSRIVEEIESAGLEPGEEEELTERSKFLRNAGRITSAIEAAYAALHGDEESGGACELISSAVEEIGYIDDTSERLRAISSRLRELQYGADDVAEELRDMMIGFDFSEEETDRVEERLNTIFRLERRYGATIPEVLKTLERSREELGELEGSDDAVIELKKRETAALGEVEKAAAELSRIRKTAALELEHRICEELATLDMKAVFKVEISQTDLSAKGWDTVRFLLSANAGEEARSLSRIASGGELARIMLAMKSVLAESDDVGTLIFDEVDAGVSGRAAQRVAEKLAALGRRRQVLCVSHLPQLAAMADNHFLIEKREQDGRTFTSVTALDMQGRVDEISRIIGGSNITQTTQKSAAELISAAEKYKETLI